MKADIKIWGFMQHNALNKNVLWTSTGLTDNKPLALSKEIGVILTILVDGAIHQYKFCSLESSDF